MCTLNSLVSHSYTFTISHFSTHVPVALIYIYSHVIQFAEYNFLDVLWQVSSRVLKRSTKEVTFLQFRIPNVCSTPAFKLLPNPQVAHVHPPLDLSPSKCIQNVTTGSSTYAWSPVPKHRSWEWVIPTSICPALLFPSPCWIWVQSPAALFASPRFSPAASGAPSAGVSGRSRMGNFTIHLQNVARRGWGGGRKEDKPECGKLAGGTMILKSTYFFKYFIPSTYALCVLQIILNKIRNSSTDHILCCSDATFMLGTRLLANKSWE